LIGNGRGQEAVKKVLLHSLNTNSRLVAKMIEYPPGATGVMSEVGQPVCSVVYVLEGELLLDSGGMHEVLGTGDCACVDSDMAIAWSAGGAARCRALVATPGIPHEG
jgi:quercetin dioxygenase-like cupin family protein